MFNVIFTIVLFLFIALFVGVGLLTGRKYQWYYSLSRLIIAAVSGVGAFFLAKLLSKLAGSGVYNILIGVLPESITAYANEIGSAPEVISALIAVILAPVVFVVLFFALLCILKLIARIVCGKIAKSIAKRSKTAEAVSNTDALANAQEAEASDKKKKAKKAKKPKRIRYIRAKGVNPRGMVCGALYGLVIFVALSVPLMGAFAVVNDVTDILSKVFPDDETVATVAEVSDASVDNTASKAISAVGTKQLFEALTTAEMGEHQLSLTKEVRLLTTIGNAVVSALDGEMSREDAAAEIRKIAPAFEDSSLIPTVAPEAMAAVDKSWDKGESFHGISKISVSGPAQAVVDPLIDMLVTSDYETIKSDAETVVEILAVLVEEDAVDTIMSDPTSIPENEELTSAILYNLFENQRFSSVINGIAEFGIQYIGEQLHIHGHKNELYDEFAEAAAQGFSAAIPTGDAELIKATAVDLFDNYGIDVSADSSSAFAERVAQSFPTGVVTGEDVKTLLASTELTLNDGRVIKLDSAETLAAESILVCMDDIVFDLALVNDKEAEAKALAKVAHEAMSLLSVINDGGIGNAESIQKVGPILDALASTKAIGENHTKLLMVGIFQSDMVHDQIGFSLIDATDIANTLCSKSTSNGYTPLLKSVSQTVEIVQIVNEGTASKEEFNEKVHVLIEDLTPENTEVLQKITTADVVEKNGVPTESAAPVANLISNVLGNLSTAKSEGMSDEQYKKEAAATSNLLNLALSTSASKDDGLFTDADSTEGEDTAISMTAAEYVDSIMDSTVICQTVVDTVYVDGSSEPTENPLNLDKELSDSDIENVLGALNTRWDNATEEEKNDEEYFKTYAAIGHMMNLPLTVDAEGKIVPVASAA